MMPKRLHLPFACLFALVLVACAAAQEAPSAGSKSTLGDLPDSVNPIDYSSPDGQFRATFPTGCARLQTKMNMADDGSTDVEVRLVFVTCERANTEKEGCLVNARLGAARGLKGKAATDLVLAEVRELLDGYGVVLARQSPIRRDFGPHGVVEGIDIQAHPEFGKGDVWIRGLLRGDDMYFLIAWKAAGGMMEDPEYGLFFQSFVPWAE
jgi:hypothetical protein